MNGTFFVLMFHVILAFLGFILIIVGMLPLCLTQKEKGNKTKSIIAKAFGTLISIAFCFYGLITNPTTTALLIFVGLLFGILGDILLEINIVAGGASFFIGNVIYIASLLRCASLQPISILIFCGIVLTIFLTYRKKLHSFAQYKLGYLAYGALIIFMASVSVPFSFVTGFYGIFFSFGTFLFVVSDYLLARKLMYQTSKTYGYISLGTYYIAQFLIAMSVYLGHIQHL